MPGLVAATAESIDVVERNHTVAQPQAAQPKADVAPPGRNSDALHEQQTGARDQIDVDCSAENGAGRGQRDHTDGPDQRALAPGTDERTVEIKADQRGKQQRQHKAAIALRTVGDP